MRRFKLLNKTGAEFDLMRLDAFLADPAGLGVGNDLTISRVGESFVVTDAKDKQPAPSGTMIFAGYAQYDEFLAFCRVGGLVLAYCPLDTWLYLDVYIDIDKSEIDYASSRLQCAVSFTATGLWYSKVTEYQATVNESGGKWYQARTGGVYGYTYDYTYTAGQNGTIEITGLTVPSYCRIHILGPAENPTWKLYQNDTLISSGKCSVSLVSGQKLIIDSDPATMELAEYTTANAYIADRYQDSDFATARFLTLPAGDSKLYFAHDGTAYVAAYVEVRKRV